MLFFAVETEREDASSSDEVDLSERLASFNQFDDQGTDVSYQNEQKAENIQPDEPEPESIQCLPDIAKEGNLKRVFLVW